MNFKETFITLSNIDVNEHTEKKGQFTYLSWTWAWKTLVENTESAAYIWNEDKVFSDGTMEVSCSLTVNDHTLPMWLAVTDYKNEAIKEPDSASINTARMRCLVKAMAMFGLGHYIYAGESFPLLWIEPTTATHLNNRINPTDNLEQTKLNGARNVPADSIASPELDSSNSGPPSFTAEPDAEVGVEVDVERLLDTVHLVGYGVKGKKTYRDCLEQVDKDIKFWGSKNNPSPIQMHHLQNLRVIQLHCRINNSGVLG